MDVVAKQQIDISVAAHDVAVWLLDTPIVESRWIAKLDRLMKRSVHRKN